MFKTLIAFAAVSMLSMPVFAHDFTKEVTLPASTDTPIVIVVPADATCSEFGAGPAPRFPLVSAKALAKQLSAKGYTNVSVSRTSAVGGVTNIAITGC